MSATDGAQDRFPLASACGLPACLPLCLSVKGFESRYDRGEGVDPTSPRKTAARLGEFRSSDIPRRRFFCVCLSRDEPLKGGVIIVVVSGDGAAGGKGISQTEISKWTEAELPKRPSRISGDCDGGGDGPESVIVCHFSTPICFGVLVSCAMAKL